MLDALASVLSLIVQPCYDLTGNWWIAILLFTVIVKILLMPVALWCQKNAIVMVKLMPALNRITVKHFGDRETIGEMQNALYKEQHYHPMLSLVPLAIQILILFGLVEVVRSITEGGAPGTEFMGMVPFEDGGASWVMPVLAGLSAIIMGFAQNRINPLQREQSKAEKNATNGLSIALSFVLGIFVSAGMAFYWICSNLMSVVVQALCNLIIKPQKYIDYADLEESRVSLDELNALSKRTTKWYQRDPLAKREKADYKRFFNIVNKHIVFYSESSGFYRYFQGAIEWLLANSDVNIHYITNDPNDQIFEMSKSEPRILPYYIGEKRLITLMMKMDADLVVMTLEDLDNYYIKRSYIRQDIEYVFMPHHMTSTHMTAAKNAYNNYDTILCVGEHQVKELRRAEELYELKGKKLVKCGYDMLDRIIVSYERYAAVKNDRPIVVIAPSWQDECILDLCAEEVIGLLVEKGYRVVVRPHPEYAKRYRARWESLQARFANISEEDLYFERDFSSADSVFMSDLLVTDWSSVACDFSFSTLRPSLFVDTPKKLSNPDYRELGLEPTDLTLRNQIGASVPLDDLSIIPALAEEMFANREAWARKIENVRKNFVYNLGGGGEAAGEYLLESILEKQKAKKAEVEHD